MPLPAPGGAGWVGSVTLTHYYFVGKCRKRNFSSFNKADFRKRKHFKKVCCCDTPSSFLCSLDLFSQIMVGLPTNKHNLNSTLLSIKSYQKQPPHHYLFHPPFNTAFKSLLTGAICSRDFRFAILSPRKIADVVPLLALFLRVCHVSYDR